MKSLLTFALLGLVSATFGQNANAHNDSLFVHELKLMEIGDSMVNSKSVLIREEAAREFIVAFRKVLALPGSYTYSFDSLIFISKLRAPNDSFRLFTWILKTRENKYRYFGVIHMNNPDSFVIHPLFDRSEDLAPGSPEEELETLERTTLVTSNENWQGYYYYDISLVSQKSLFGKSKGNYYVLLGWDGNNGISHKKVVDVLSFRSGKPQFGAPIIKTTQGNQTRLVLESNAEAVITLKYHHKDDMISFDLLVPPSNKNIGKYFTYVPSGQYDFLIWKRNKFIYKEDIFNSYKKTIVEAQ